MDLKTTTYAVDNKIATITLSRSHRGNAWTGRMPVGHPNLPTRVTLDGEAV